MQRNTVQQFSGTPMTEPECFARAMDHMQSAINCFRGLAVMRRDMKWLIAVRNMEKMIDQVKAEINKGGAPLLWLPERVQ